jgi:hypothetical protein
MTGIGSTAAQRGLTTGNLRRLRPRATTSISLARTASAAVSRELEEHVAGLDHLSKVYVPDWLVMLNS